MTSAGKERRRYPRSKRKIETVSGDGEGIVNHIDNISANGVLCHTLKPIPLMTRMCIGLELPAPVEQRIECEGVVVRCEAHEQENGHFKVAILFTKIEPEVEKAIAKFVAHDLAHNSDEGE